MKQWLMPQKLVALNTMCRKTPGKQVTYRTRKGAEKQLDYVLMNRKDMSSSRDAEANDMIHMGSDHRSVMAQFVIKAQTKGGSQKPQIEGKTNQQRRGARSKEMEEKNPRKQA